jgi:hypothetical protein
VVTFFKLQIVFKNLLDGRDVDNYTSKFIGTAKTLLPRDVLLYGPVYVTVFRDARKNGDSRISLHCSSTVVAEKTYCGIATIPCTLERSI